MFLREPDNPKRRAGVKFDGQLSWTPDWTLSLQQASAKGKSEVGISARSLTVT